MSICDYLFSLFIVYYSYRFMLNFLITFILFLLLFLLYSNLHFFLFAIRSYLFIFIIFNLDLVWINLELTLKSYVLAIFPKLSRFHCLLSISSVMFWFYWEFGLTAYTKICGLLWRIGIMWMLMIVFVIISMILLMSNLLCMSLFMLIISCTLGNLMNLLMLILILFATLFNIDIWL